MAKKLVTGEKVLHEHKWLQMRERDGKPFSHESSQGVAVLGWRINDDTGTIQILGRYEPRLPHNNFGLYSLTGCIDAGETPLETAVRELKEEAGIKANPRLFVYLGRVHPHKVSTSITHLFSVLLTSEPKRTKGDGSKEERASYCKWLDLDKVYNSRDPVLHSLILKLLILQK